MGNKGVTEGPPKQLTAKQIAMLKTSTNYSETEIRKWHANFLRDCPTGKLNKTQFVHMYKIFYSGGNADAFCQLAFSMFDANRDGVIDFNEFLLAVAATCHGDLNNRLEVVFDICDTSDDGHIDQKELAIMISAMYDLLGETDRKADRDPEKRASEIISKLDVSGDKKLNKHEFIVGCTKDPIIRHLLAPNA
ncbi:unnamed protein product [Rotaria sordida]|uniref:EF-hand domain-containing protein n=1 Tax=Rotaria sordida TaxID=392033 RepID=A0A814TEQ9_9BILA|nr:unnamed protein product [Rotaria sordida]